MEKKITDKEENSNSRKNERERRKREGSKNGRAAPTMMEREKRARHASSHEEGATMSGLEQSSVLSSADQESVAGFSRCRGSDGGKTELEHRRTTQD